jgi:GDP-mannose 6-dehydrogenase
MKISVFGLGYVGCVSAACLARLGHRVIGVDVNPEKVRLIRSGQSTIVEEEIGDIVREAVQKGSLTATESSVEGVLETQISLICVGTPSNENGSLNLQYIESGCRSIGEGLAQKKDYHVVVDRSTMLPGSMRGTVIPALESASGKNAGRDFGVCINPEFLREGTSVRDFHQPPYTVIGSLDEKSAQPLMEMYSALNAPLLNVPIEVAEMIKYASNSYHAVKICFANEMGRICKAAGVDSHLLMDVFCKDDKLNVSKAYLKPGFAFGGSCLPKDVRALNYYARSQDVEVPMLASLMPSNRAHLDQAIRLITRGGRRNIGIVGLSFKPGTDDLRESPMVHLVEHLMGRGFPVRIYDANVQISSLFGANRQYIEKEVPHIEKYMTANLDELIAFAEVLVVGHKQGELHTYDLKNKEIIQLERLNEVITAQSVQGISW